MKYRLIANTKNVPPSENKKYANLETRSVNAGEVVEIDDYNLRIYRPSDHKMIDSNGDKCGTYGDSLYWEIEEVVNIHDSYIALQDACGIKVGDKVKVLRKAKTEEMGWIDSWHPYMDDMIGKIYTVTGVSDRGILIGGWWLPFFVLEKVFQSITRSLIDTKGYTHSVVVSENTLQVDANIFDEKVIDQLMTIWQNRKTQ